jgi:hypothetical protein
VFLATCAAVHFWLKVKAFLGSGWTHVICLPSLLDLEANWNVLLALKPFSMTSLETHGIRAQSPCLFFCCLGTSDCAQCVQLVSKFGILDIALLEAALSRHSTPNATRAEVSAAIAECACIVATELEEEEERGRATQQSATCVLATCEECPNAEAIGQQRMLMGQVEAIIDLGSLHFIPPQMRLGRHY